MAAHDLTVAHQLDLGRITHADRSEVRLLEISVDPEGIGVDDRDGVHADIDVVAELREQVRYVAVDRGDECACARDSPAPGAAGLGLREIASALMRCAFSDATCRSASVEVCLCGLAPRPPADAAADVNCWAF